MMKLLLLTTLLGGSAAAQEANERDALAKASQNPIADLTALPFQFNFNSGAALGDATLYNMNFQPVMPLSLSAHWNLIARTIVPYYSLARITGGRGTGVGDINQQLYFTETAPHAVTIGFGPVLSLPTATLADVRTGSWAVGPGIVVVRTTGPWVLGVLVNQLWTAAKDPDNTQINLLTLQPFVNYNLPGSWSFGTAPIVTGNFAIDSGQKWTLPVGLGVSKITTIGPQSVSLSLYYYYNSIRPDNSGNNLVRFVASFLFPVRPKK